MLSGWDGYGGSTITEKELNNVGYDAARQYCTEYCWLHGNGCCDACAYEKARKEKEQTETIGGKE